MAERVESAERMPDQTDRAVAAETGPETPWRGGFAGPFSSIRLAAQRLGRSWRLLLAVELGMLISVALLATAPFYSDLVASAQLQSVLTSSAPTDRNIQIAVTVPSLYDPQTPAESRLSTLDTTVNGDVMNTIGPVTSGQSGSTEYLQALRPLALVKINGKSVTTAAPEYHVGAQDLAMSFDYTRALPHMKLLAGRTPRDTPPGADPEVMVTPAMGVQPGAILHFQDADYAKFGFDARVVGVWFPKDESGDPYWNGLRFDTVIAPNISNPPPAQYPVLFTRTNLVQTLASNKTPVSHIAMGVGLNYIYYVNSDSLTIAQASGVQTNVKALRAALDVDVPGVAGAAAVSVGTHLDQIIGGVSNVLAAQTLPLYSVDAELVALALLFIFIMAGLLIESQSSEIATLKSRGASTTQILLTYLSQGVILAAVALGVGMVMAGGLALTLVRFFVPLNHAVFSTLTPAYVARSLSLRHALIPASVGAGLGVVALALASWQAARMDALAFRREQGRSERVPFWKRYYLDVGLAVLCIAGYTELVTFGGLTTRTLVNAQGASQQPGGQADLIQLLAPTLMLLAGALLFQRITPPLLRFGAWLTTRGRGATGMLAFAQVSRASGMFSRLTLLLTLAVGLGLFALTFQTTIAQGAHDDAYYLVGGDERVSIKSQMEGTQSTLGYAAAFAKMPGVERVSPMYRGITLTMPNQGGQNVDILGVDPTTFAQTTTAWRGDYASQSLPALMNIIERSRHGPSMGMANTPMVALVDQTFANTYALRVGSRFQLSPQEAGAFSTASSAYFVVGAIVNDFPSLYDGYGTGYIVVDLNDYLGALANPNIAAYTVNGPNDFLLRTTADPSAAAKRAKALEDPNFFVQQTYDARALTTTYRADPVSAGMSGLLLLGALIAALLALVGVITQAAIAARRRQTQFAILRTLGLSGGALIRMLLAEQALVYLLGALGGIAIGALLSAASLPFLGFTTSTYMPPVIGVPPSQPAINFGGSLLFMAALLIIFIVALIVAGAVARAVGLGRALRVGED